MKAFLNRLNRGLAGSKEKDRDRDKDAALQKEKIPQLPPLPDWPPRAPSTTPSVNSFKPLPEIAPRPLPPIEEPSSSSTDSSLNNTPVPANQPLPAPDTKENVPAPSAANTPSHSSRSEHDSTGRSSRKNANGTSTGTDAHKKVAFISPPPTPAPLSDRELPSADTSTPPAPTVKSTVSRFHAAHGKDSRGSTSTAASSRTDVASTLKSNKAASTRTATSPYPGKSYGAETASLHQSLRSGTPYSSMSNAGSRILAVQSWSEGAEEDLVSNLGQRERTRQEVLWEIVASEERYVNELLKMKETFIEPLLHPYVSSPISSPTPLLEFDDFPRSDTPRESLEHLPIAARFLGSPTGERSESPVPLTPQQQAHRKDDNANHPNIDGESVDSADEDEADDRMGASFQTSRQKTVAMSLAAKHNHPRSPYGTTAARSGPSKYGVSVPFPSRSHQSLPPPPRANAMASSTQSLGRQSLIADSHAPSMRTTGTGTTRVLKKFRKSNPKTDVLIPGAVPPAQLPEDLRKCLEVIEDGILDGHIRLSDGLRKRYEEQYPLVRSLADVFVSNAHILHGYATYVLHLERALEQVDNALSTASASKKPKKQDADQWLKVCQYLQKLEVTASEKGETGLAISLSKPFQRLLKYPLLFQNLLYHTDPSTFEYESTLQMVAEVETIVRSIEDEKIQKEERDKTRDVFARIEGLDKVKQLMVPKPSRVLVEERPLTGVNPLSLEGNSSSHTSAGGASRPSPPPTSQNAKNVKGKTSFKRLSDVLQAGTAGVGGKKDLWLVVFNDVVLRCQRTGTTSLPLVSATNSRVNSLPELQGKAKYATTGRRSAHTKPRNLYKFIKIETWAIGDVVQPREGVVAMEEVVKSRQQAHSGVQPRIVPMPEDDEEGGESDDSDRKSKMSFSYWGADKVTLQKPVVVKPKVPAANGARRPIPGATTAYARESSANAKFGTRLVSTEVPHAARPASRRTQATPVNRKVTPHSDEGHSMKVTVTRDHRPGWDSSTRATSTTPVPKRPRHTSQTSAATRVTTTPTAMTTATGKNLGSPAPSEDSGIGFIRNMVTQDPSLNRLIQ